MQKMSIVNNVEMYDSEQNIS